MIGRGFAFSDLTLMKEIGDVEPDQSGSNHTKEVDEGTRLERVHARESGRCRNRSVAFV